jgi:hypothetical protein
MALPDALVATLAVTRVLEELAVPYLITGSLDTPQGRQEMERRQPMRLPDLPETVLHVASAEDTIVQKLAWYRLGGEVSGHQWKDALGIIKVRRQDLDLAYLRQAAAALAIADLLDRALIDGGVEKG